MTREQRNKRLYNARFHSNKRAKGWKYYSTIVPPEVLKGLLEAKARLMEMYREKHGDKSTPADAILN